MKRVATIIIAVLLIAALSVTAFAEYTDVAQDAWYAEAVDFLTELGVLDGYGDGRFGPDDSLVSAQLLKIVDMIFFPDEVGPEEEGDTWGVRYYDAALSHELITEEFITPDELYTVINRYKVAVVLDNILVSVLGETVEPDEDIASKIGDYDTIPEEYVSAVETNYTAGIIGGCDAAGSFLGEDPLTRGQAAQIVLRLLKPEKRTINLPPPEERTIPEIPEVPEVPALTPMDDEWWENTMFLGDSLTHGLSLYGGFKVPTYYYNTGMSVFNVASRTLECSKGGTATLTGALTAKNWDRVFILLGINEIWSGNDSYIASYSTLIDTVRTYAPNAEICIQTLLPVSRAKDAEGSFTRSAVRRRNEALWQLAVEKECLIVNIHSALADSEDFLPAAATWDGVHLNSDRYRLWVDYVRSFTGY